jgi:hypothetical protein
MKLNDLIAKLIDMEIQYGNYDVELSVGGDGAIHSTTSFTVDAYDLPNGSGVVRLEG